MPLTELRMTSRRRNLCHEWNHSSRCQHVADTPEHVTAVVADVPSKRTSPRVDLALVFGLFFESFTLHLSRCLHGTADEEHAGAKEQRQREGETGAQNGHLWAFEDG